MNIILPIVLLIVGILAFIIEIFVPASGILGAFGLVLIIVSVVMSYIKMGSMTGSIFLIISLISLPTLFALAFKIFPKTFFGKKLILSDSQKKEDGFESNPEESYKVLEGHEGNALTALRPTGIALIDSKKYNVMSSGEFIEKNALIKVIKVEGNKITVKSK